MTHPVRLWALIRMRKRRMATHHQLPHIALYRYVGHLGLLPTLMHAYRVQTQCALMAFTFKEQSRSEPGFLPSTWQYGVARQTATIRHTQRQVPSPRTEPILARLQRGHCGVPHTMRLLCFL